ncbi:hypothetical protein FACS1894151_00840 [Spirochaetia bacterium]|nr:hypothetical protein FACS1894151_00840 [Spirochaetia bacterium]
MNIQGAGIQGFEIRGFFLETSSVTGTADFGVFLRILRLKREILVISYLHRGYASSSVNSLYYKDIGMNLPILMNSHSICQSTSIYLLFILFLFFLCHKK